MRSLGLIAAILAAMLLISQSTLAQNAALSSSPNARGIEKKDIRRGMVIAKPGGRAMSRTEQRPEPKSKGNPRPEAQKSNGIKVQKKWLPANF